MRTAEAIALDCDGDDYYRRCPDCGGSGSQAGKVSSDGGRTWSPAKIIDGVGSDTSHSAAWQVPIVAPSGRITICYTYSHGRPAPFFGGFRWRHSDDHGQTWSKPVDLATFPTGHYDSQDGSMPPVWICCSGPHVGPSGEILIPYTRWAWNDTVAGGNTPIKTRHSHIEVMRINNLDEAPDLHNLHITWLNTDNPITVPHATIDGASFAQEPYLANLPDGRILMVMRTNRGELWYTVSDDAGQTWRKTEPMRYHDNDEIIKQPASPCPIFGLKRGDYLLLFNDNDGLVFGAQSVWAVENRRPAFVSRGEFRPNAQQPIWWSKPELFIDNDAHPWGPEGKERLEAATYTSLTEHRGERILWYPDRKGFLLGKIIADGWLDALDVPS